MKYIHFLLLSLLLLVSGCGKMEYLIDRFAGPDLRETGSAERPAGLSGGSQASASSSSRNPVRKEPAPLPQAPDLAKIFNYGGGLYEDGFSGVIQKDLRSSMVRFGAEIYVGGESYVDANQFPELASRTQALLLQLRNGVHSALVGSLTLPENYSRLNCQAGILALRRSHVNVHMITDPGMQVHFTVENAAGCGRVSNAGYLAGKAVFESHRAEIEELDAEIRDSQRE